MNEGTNTLLFDPTFIPDKDTTILEIRMNPTVTTVNKLLQKSSDDKISLEYY